MKQFIFIITLSLLLFLSAYADSANSTAQNLLNRTGAYVTNNNILNFLRTFGGDTISFNITEVNDIDFFTKEMPDTIWIKKRPKKNPKEGKHYRLSYTYKGLPNASGKYRTPIAAIKGKLFGVLSVNHVNDDSYYSKNKDILFKLVDLDDHSIVNCLIPYYNGFSFAISSNKIDRDISSLVGKEFYVRTIDKDYTPKYTLCTLKGGEYSILFNSDLAGVTVNMDVKLHLIDKEGYEVPFEYKKPQYHPHYYDEAILSRAEYEDRHTVRTINSKIDKDIVNSEVELPFDFMYIIGTRNGYSAKISQSIDPDKLGSYSWTSEYRTAPANENMFVGGSINVRDTKFLKMIYNGKAFFMKADDVTLSQDSKAKLDSLENCSNEVQELFWHKTLFLNQWIYYDRLEEALKEMQSYAKYGLAVKDWQIYDESEYTDGTSINITFVNPTKQVIKYISITFQGYNAVDDPYGRPITKRCIGPIEPNETANYKFDYVWFSDLVEYAKIRSINVTYKNGTTKTIKNAKTIMLSDKTRETVFGSDPVEGFN